MINYSNVSLPDNVDDILGSDFWAYRHVGADMLRTIVSPVKFTSTVGVFVRSGSCRADIDLIGYEVKAPALVNIRSSQIIFPKEVSPDFDASFIVISKEVADSLMLHINVRGTSTAINFHPVVAIPEEFTGAFDRLYDDLVELNSDTGNPYRHETVVYTLASFFFRYGHRCYDSILDSGHSSQGRIAARFLSLVQQNFRHERFLDFYAAKLNITAKHLSRTVKAETGATAVEWIERYVMLEAKVMLKSSNLTVQQIAEELHFPTQSFFGKYFKKHAGVSPKEFRNS